VLAGRFAEGDTVLVEPDGETSSASGRGTGRRRELTRRRAYEARHPAPSDARALPLSYTTSPSCSNRKA